MWNSSGGKGNSSGHYCLSGVCGIEHYVMIWYFQTVSRGHILVFFNRHCSTMNLVKEKQGGLVPPGLKDGHSSSSSISPTLLVFLLQAQRATVL